MIRVVAAGLGLLVLAAATPALAASSVVATVQVDAVISPVTLRVVTKPGRAPLRIACCHKLAIGCCQSLAIGAHPVHGVDVVRRSTAK